MGTRYFIIFLFVLRAVVGFAQQTQGSSSETDLEFRGTISTNTGTTSEYFEQRRSILWGLSLGNSSKVQLGISKSRAGNIDIVELPLIYKHQIHENVNVYGGMQVQLLQDAVQDSGPSFRKMQATFGMDYDITPTWDAGVQFVIPLTDEGIPQIQMDQPIRLRTGIKF